MVENIARKASANVPVSATAPGMTTRVVASSIADLRLKVSDLEAQVARYKTAINSVSSGIAFFDSNERLILFNHGYAEMYRIGRGILRTGMTLPEIMEHRVASRTAPVKGVGGYIDYARSIDASTGPKNKIVELMDGRTTRVCHQPMPDGGWVVTHEDITDLAATHAIESERISLQALLDAVPDYLWVKDTESRFVAANKALAFACGRAQTSDMIGLTDLDLHSADLAHEFRAIEQRIIQTGQPMIDREELVTELSGFTKCILSTKMPLCDTSGEIFGIVGISRDITDRVRVAEELGRAREFLDLVLESVPDAILVKDVNTRRFTMVNQAAELLVGLSRADVLGKTAEAIYNPDYLIRVYEEDEKLLTQGELFLDNHVLELRERESRIVTINRKLLRNVQGAPQFMLTVIHDITERRRAEERAAYLARHDALTKLPNRAAFNDVLAQMIENANSKSTRFAVLFIDLDRLKEVNDLFGHAAGDRLLCEVSQRLLIAAGDAFVARLGGDEFAILTEDAEPPSHLAELTGRLTAAVDSDIDIDGTAVQAGLSIGVAVFPDNGDNGTSLLANADAALYRAKAECRGSARFFEQDMDQQLRERHLLRHDLNLAIERGELEIHYQPQAKITGEINGFEALLRWRHPQRGAVPPNAFIPVAEESSLIIRIGEWVLREACREAAAWPRPLGIAVNLSPVQIQDGNLVNLVHTILLETGLNASRLELEITEGVLISNTSRAHSVLRQLKALGVQITMDDFGKGYSSLSYLQSFPFDKIKIDRSFVSKVARQPQSAAIVRAVIGLARGLGMPVLAEGVETEEELAFLTAEACEQVQGYLIGRPLPISAYSDTTGEPQHPSVRVNN